MQQKASLAQTALTQWEPDAGLSQPDVSLRPVEHSPWTQLPVIADEPAQLAILHTVATCCTHSTSQALVQQNGSTLQIDGTHGSQELADFGDLVMVHLSSVLGAGV